MRPSASDHFEHPVVILTGLGHPAAISSAMEAYVFLSDWPLGKRDASHGFAFEGCLAAIRGEIDPETARGLFFSWAEANDIIGLDVAAFASSRFGSHGLA